MGFGRLAGPDLDFDHSIELYICFFPTYWLQRHFRRDSRLTALWKALLFGVIAAVPTSVTGTPIGLALLAWAGIKR
jgi:ABC-type spermidine/putrescine transport system permease subunit II